MSAKALWEAGHPPTRRLQAGAEFVASGVSFRVWAPTHRGVEAILERADGHEAHPLDAERDGWFSATIPGARAGDQYRFRLDGGHPIADPASRFQPRGPDGPSEIVDPSQFPWTDAGWRGARLEGRAFYELHVGTFTEEGTWGAASSELLRLAELGVTAVELMPVAEFPGRFGWGYDGVDLYAPSHRYGAPDDMRRFVDRAHSLGLGVILDVVYNHVGPRGSVFREYTPDYFSRRYRGEWGDPLNFDGERSGPVRAFVTDNAAYWISEFHLDGLRLDATQGMFDASGRHIVAEVAEHARGAASGRRVVLVAENEPQQARLLRPEAEGGLGLDAAWNDDFHHAVSVALTGRREAYFMDHAGTPQELVSAAKHGFLFQGQQYAWQGKPRGTSTRGIPPRAFVCYLENHDQVANGARGLRLRQRTGPGRWRAATALLLLGPWTPLLFQGAELASERPFLYFADHSGELGRKVRDGRAAFVRQFPSVAGEDMRDRLRDPGDERTFRACKLERGGSGARGESLALHRDLLEMRRSDPVLRMQGAAGMDGAVLGPEALCLRFFSPDALDRLLLVNLGRDLDVSSAAEPLLAPPDGHGWTLAWSSEDPRYGGCGTPNHEPQRLLLLGQSATLLIPHPGEMLA